MSISIALGSVVGVFGVRGVCYPPNTMVSYSLTNMNAAMGPLAVGAQAVHEAPRPLRGLLHATRQVDGARG